MSGRERLVLLGSGMAVVLFALWLLFTGSVSRDELIVGAGSTVLSCAFAVFAMDTSDLSFRPSLRDIAEVWRVPGEAALGMWQITFVLVRDFGGRRAASLFRSIPFAHVGQSGEDVARRTLAVAYTTVAPNTVVIGVDRQRGQFLFHELLDAPTSQVTKELGGGQ